MQGPYEGKAIPLVAPETMREYAGQQLKEFDGTKLNPIMKEGLDFGDQDEKKILEEKKIEPEQLGKLMKLAQGSRQLVFRYCFFCTFC